MKNCIFCKIIKREIDSAKIWEDKDFLAILDVNPNTKGMTLVLTKKHYDSYAFKIPKKIYQKFMLATKKVAKILEKGLKVKRVAMVMEGMGVNHAHLKLYPLYGLNKKFEEIINAQGGKVKEIYLSKIKHDLFSEKSGRIKGINNKEINYLAKVAGCPLDKYAGVYLYHHLNERVKKGDKILTLYAESKPRLNEAIKYYHKKLPIKISFI